MFKKTTSYRNSIEPDLLVGLDLGTSKVTVVVAERGIDGDEAQIIGVGQAPSNGMRKGLIVNLDQAVKSVKQAVSDAQNMVGQDLSNVTVAFGGGEVTSIISKGMVSLGRAPRPVVRPDIERVIDSAQADIVVPNNQTILHTIPIEYSLDGNVGIDDPLGMNAMRLDIEVQSIIVPTATIQNVTNCVNRAGLEVDGLVIKPLAAALGVLTPEDALAGTAVIDIGGGTTGVAIFADGRSKHLALLPVGGDHITNDVGIIYRLSLNKAEELKRTVSLNHDFDDDEKIRFSHSSRDYEISKSDLYEIVRCRLDELANDLLKPQIKSSGVSLLPGGILLTGGVSKTEGIEEFMIEAMDLPVRVALPYDTTRMPPRRNTQEYASAAGIIKYILTQERDPFRYLDKPAINLGKAEASKSTIFMPSHSDTASGGKEHKESPLAPLKTLTDMLKDLF